MIRTEILIRAGRQHLSRSILARAVGRRTSTKAPTFLNSHSTAHRRSNLPRGPSHSLPLLHPSQRRNSEITFGREAMHQRHSLLLRAVLNPFLFLFFFHKHQAIQERSGKSRKTVHYAFGNSRVAKTKKRKKNDSRVTVIGHYPAIPSRRHVDAVRPDSRLNRSERSTWSRGCPSRRPTLTTPPPFS